METIEYPNNPNDTEQGNEGNYLASVLTQAYLDWKRGLLSNDEYKLIKEKIEQQKRFIKGTYKES